MNRNSRRAASWLIGFLVAGGSASGQAIVIDHTTLPLFDRIPESYLEAARNLRVFFMDRSVGFNTHTALNCFTASDYGSSPVTCRRDYRLVAGAWQMTTRTPTDLAAGLVPEYIRFLPDPARYNRSNWLYYTFADTWDKMTVNFVSGLHNRSIPAADSVTNQPLYLNPLDFDVISFQFSYLNVDQGSTIGEFFTRRPGAYDDAYDLEREIGEVLDSASPRRVFVYWTTSLARGIGTDEATAFNERMRQWCRERGRILLDFADIEAHDMNGNPCYDNRDGVPYITPSGNASENYPDDGRNIPAICQEKTTETDGGHLGTAQGVVSVAKGMWILMARIAGWDPGGMQRPAAPTNLRIVP